MRSFIPLVLLPTLATAQVTTYVVAPANLQGHAEFTWAQWTNTPDLNDGSTAVQDTAVFVDDGTVADSLGCNPLVNGASVNGNIAVVYRGTCEIGTKALQAQNEGARAVVVINNVPGSPVQMGEGINGNQITIPVVMITDTLGMDLRADILAGTCVLLIGQQCLLTNTCNDVWTHVAHTYHVPGFQVMYWLNVQNASWTTSFYNVTAALEYDPTFTFDSASVVPAVNTPGYLEWNIDTLSELELAQFKVYLTVPANPGLIGMSTAAAGTGGTAVPDDNPANDVHYIMPGIFGAFDPNDKQAATVGGPGFNYFMIGDDHIDYTIRFQNTGNAPATDVVLVDTLSPLFQYAPLHVLGASHAHTAERIGQVLRFTFPNIQLPDSASDPLGSQGFVSFRLPLQLNFWDNGLLITNAADIYFDFNPPIRTNTSVLEAMIPWSVQEEAVASARIMPNPARDLLTIVPDVGLAPQRIVLRSTTGQVLRDLSWPPGDAQALLDVSQLATGLYTVEVRGDHSVAVARVVKE